MKEKNLLRLFVESDDEIFVAPANRGCPVTHIYHINCHNVVWGGTPNITIHQYGNTETDVKPASAEEENTDDDLRERLKDFLTEIHPKRMWFCVMKALMECDYLLKNDFHSAAALLTELFPELTFSDYEIKNILKLNCYSFSKDIDEWSPNNSPFEDGETIRSYIKLAQRAKRKLKR